MWLTSRRIAVAQTSVCPGRLPCPYLGARANGQEESLIKLDIINEVVNKTGITKTKAEMAVETVFESMKKALEHGDRIELRGFGVFNVKPRKTGIGRNPRTGAEVSIPPGKAVRFKPGKELQTLH
jgi:DNA-binding protein HU-beta